MAVAMAKLLQFRFVMVAAAASLASSGATAAAAALVGETCSSSSSSSSCGAGLRCTSCVPPPGTGPAACARTTPMDPTKAAAGTGLPFNRYAWLTTHNSFAVVGTKSPIGSAIIAPPNQEDAVTAQLRNGVRGLMLDAYAFNNDVWLCHSFNGKCFAFTAFAPALSVLREIQAFLESNPSEVVTIFLEDYTGPGALAKVFAGAGLTKYLFPVDKMPRNGGDWPLLKDMIAQNQRLVVFTSKQGKEASDGMAYQWNYVVETQYGSDGLGQEQCKNRGESRPMDSKAQSLVLMNFFTTNPSQSWACGNNSSPLIAKLKACYQASANRWPNFIAVDFYMRSSGGGAPLATDVANGRLQCGSDSIASCKANVAVAPSSSPSPSPTKDVTSSSPSTSFSLSLSPSPSSSATASSSSPSPSPTVAVPPSLNDGAPAVHENMISSRRRQVSEHAAGTATSSEVASAGAATHRRPCFFLFTMGLPTLISVLVF